MVEFLYILLIGSFAIGLMSVGGLLVYEWMEGEIEFERDVLIDEVKKLTIGIDVIDETNK